MNVRRLVPLVAVAAGFGSLLIACGPSASDRTNMAEKMSLETQRAAIWTANVPNCAKLGVESTAFNKTNHDKIVGIDAWWGKLGKRAKDKLIEENRSVWDGQSNALVQTMMTCPTEIKASLKGQ
jgi:hypothetical protein